MNSHPAEPIVHLLRAHRAGEIELSDFCAAYETCFNFDLDRTALSSREGSAAQKLFDQIVRYSPLEDERRQITHYIGPDEVEAAIADASTVFLD